MSRELLEEWAQELKDSYDEQITTRLKRQIKKNTISLLRTIRNKEIGSGEFSEEVTRRIATISYLKRVLRSMLSDDLKEYKNYLRVCIKEGYPLKLIDETDALYDFLARHNNARPSRMKKIKGILLQKISKYSS